MNKKYFHCQFLYRGCCRFLELVQLPGRHDVMVHQDVRLQVLGLLLGRTQPQPGGSRVSWPDTAREHVRQRVPQLLAATQRSEVPAVVRGAQQRRLGPGLRHAGAGPHQQLPLLLGRRLCHRPRKEVPAPRDKQFREYYKCTFMSKLSGGTVYLFFINVLIGSIFHT